MFASVSFPRPRKREKIPSSFAVSDSNTLCPYLVLGMHEASEKLPRRLWDIMRVFFTVCQARAVGKQRSQARNARMASP